MQYEKPQCAGQGQRGSEHCGQPNCPICYTFGHITGDRMYSGVVNIFDAHLLLFPVHSVVGPVWVSTQERLQEAGFTVENVPQSWDEDKILTTLPDCQRLNLGWLMLDVVETGPKIAITPPDEWKEAPQWEAVAKSLVLVPDSLFSHIVNSNLEVRTSVAINPETGAAEDKALFTYEAIPRAAFLTAEVVLDDYVPDQERPRPFPKSTTGKANPLPGGEWKGPLDVVRAGLGMIEYLSVGGMGTRGFGRIKLIGNAVEKAQEDIFASLEERP
jgi:CRISPR-associated protein Cmr4